jgi:2-methylaconitate cis-trans-isomerase PrpF
LRVGAVAAELANGWTIHLASMSRSARIIMEGSVRVPPNL